MMKLFTTRQIAEIDRYTIEHEPISDIDLMERAAGQIAMKILTLVPQQQELIFYAGPGNNGGDALAVARLLGWAGYPCKVYLMDLGKSLSPSAEINLQRLEEQGKAEIRRIQTESDFPVLRNGSIVIDGLFGSGLTRPLDGLAAELVRHINRLTAGNLVSGNKYQDIRHGAWSLEHGAKSSKHRAQGTGHRKKNDLREQTDLGDQDFSNSQLTNQQSQITNFPLGEVEASRSTKIKVISVDLPSGLMGEDNSGNNPEHIIRADHTITLQFPKISLLLPDNESYTGEVHVVDIGLHRAAITQTESAYSITEKPEIACLFPPRPRFAHKGTYGHALLLAGSYGKMGAAVLAAKACLRSGAGLVTAHIPVCGYAIMQTAVPEVMCLSDPGQSALSAIPSLASWTAIGAGPGMGTQPETHTVIRQLIDQATVPLVFDADALNILALHQEWLSVLPENTILTPHPGEFRRLFGDTGNAWQRLQVQRMKARELGIIIVLKGAWSTIALPDGRLFFNPTGNPGMATGGSGDVLTGIILGLLARHIPPDKAAIAGVYLHGLAGDLAAKSGSEQALIASDITGFLGEAFKEVIQNSVYDF